MHQTNEHGANTPLRENLSLLCRIAGEQTVRDRVRSSIIEQLSSAYPSGEKIADLRTGTSQEHDVSAREWKDIFDDVSGQYLEKSGHSYRIQGASAGDLRGKFLQRSAQFRRMEALCDYFGIAITDPETLRQETEILTKNLLLPQEESETREGDGKVSSHSRLLIRALTETQMKLYSVLTLLRAGGRLNLKTYSRLLARDMGFGKDDLVHVCAAISQMEADTHGAVSTAIHNDEWMLEADPHHLREPLEESAAYYDTIAMHLAKIGEEFAAKATRTIKKQKAKKKHKTAAVVLPSSEVPTKKMHLVRSRRLERGIPVRTAAKFMGCSVQNIRLQEQESTDLRISDLRAWQKVLNVPLSDLIVESEERFATKILNRNQCMRIVKVAQAIEERSDSVRIRRMARTLAGQIAGIQPELGALSALLRKTDPGHLASAPSNEMADDDSDGPVQEQESDEKWREWAWKGEVNDTASFGQRPETPHPKQHGTALHCIRTVRQREGFALRSAARHTGKHIRTLRLEEQESTDLRISDLLLWQKALDVPLIELLEDTEEGQSEPVEERAQILLVMKTLMAICEGTLQASVRKMTEQTMGELISIMPELRGISAWQQIGQRRGYDELGRAAERQIPENLTHEQSSDEEEA